MTADTEDLMQALDARVARRDSRRAFFTAALGAGAVGMGAFAFASAANAQSVTDADVLNFALNLEYLEANFYAKAVTGDPIPNTVTTGTGTRGPVIGGRRVTGLNADPVVAAYAQEIAADELAHVIFLRTALGAARIAQPRIDISARPDSAFSKAAVAAGLIRAGETFDPYSSPENFLLGAFIFEDVGVTAYKGSAGLLTNKEYLVAAAGIHAVEAYHAAIVRTTLFRKGIAAPAAAGLIAATEQISNARDSLDGPDDVDQGVSTMTVEGFGTVANIAPLDGNGLAYSRSAEQVLNIVYLSPNAVTMGGFFPDGVNGTIRTSAQTGPAPTPSTSPTPIA